MLTYRAVIQSGDTLRALDAVTSQARHHDWMMDESNWFKPALIVRDDTDLPLREYDVEERLNVRLALPLLRLADSLPRLGKIHTVWLFNVIVTSLTVGLVYCLARSLEFNEATAAIVAMTAGLGTILWAYSQTFFREPLSALFVAAALLFIQNGKRYQLIFRLISVMLAAAALILAYSTKYSAVFAIPAALVFALPDAHGASQRFSRRLALLLLVSAGAVLALFIIVDPLPATFQTLFAQFGLNTDFTGAALRSYLLSPGASIWGTSPILLLAVPGCILLWRQQRHYLVLAVVACLVCYAIGHALTTNAHWFGGLSWPPRFLLPVLPVVILACAPVAQAMLARGQARLRALWFILLLYGVWIQFSGVSLSWSHYGETLPVESQGLAEWLPSMFQPRYFRWVLLPQRWQDLGFDFLWTRADLPMWGISFALIAGVTILALARLLRHSRSRWRYASPLLLLICLNLILLNLTAAYDSDPRTQSGQQALHKVRDYLVQASHSDDILLLSSNDYGNFVLNHFDGAEPRSIILPRPLAQAASDRQPAQVVSNNPNSWFNAQTLRVIQHVAGHHDRLWVLDNTSPFMPWSFRPLERYLALNYYLIQDVRLAVPDDTVRLLEYSTAAAAPDVMSLYFGDASTDLRFGDSIRLAAYVLPTGTRYRPGEAVLFSLLWQTATELNRDYTVATFIAEETSNQVLVQGYDSGPQAGFARTSTWEIGISIWDNRAIQIPSDAEPGDYRLWVVMYGRDGETGDISRLPVHGAHVAGEGTIGVLPFLLELR